ncbi:MAG: SRPBCC family protein [Myxococcota bacterium]
MYTIHVTQTFEASIEQVFEALSDHETFLTRGDTACRLIETGHEERNGVGAVREVRSGALRFIEAIPEFERPTSYTYRIRTLTVMGLPLPVVHDQGWLEFHRTTDSTTRVDWRSRFRITIPIIGAWLEPRLGDTFSAAFLAFMKAARTRLETGANG